ncbi:MAG: outer membrane protein assembly factor BamC [Idiomarina sp.]|nr:outer membrane protein assembly factor BamC [Idiomarina sp.]
MKFTKVGAIALSALIVSGCAAQRDLAEGGFDYLEVEDRGQLVVPEGLNMPAQRAQYRLPQLSAEQQTGSIGSAVSVRSPRQVLTLAPGSRTEDGISETRLAFDAVEGISDLPAWVWSGVESVVGNMGAEIVVNEPESRIVTARFEQEHYTVTRPGFLNRLRRVRDTYTSMQTIEVAMQSAPHRRSAVIDARVSDISWYVNGREMSRQDTPVMLQRDLEAGVLNRVSAHLNTNYSADRMADARRGVEIRQTETADGFAAIAFESSFNVAWGLMPSILENIGFILDDFNQSEGVLYTAYEPEGKRGFFKRLAFWRSRDGGPLPLRAGTEVEFNVDERDGVVYIIANIDDQPVSAEQISAWMPAFVEAFRVQTEE